MNGIDGALGEITLVFFTTLAPAGVMAIMLMALPHMCGWVNPAERASIDHAMNIPLAIALVGLVASTTHLGNPANALYVLMGTGRSPLSNEVVAAACFFACAGTYWVSSYSDVSHELLRRIALVLILLVGAGFITAIGYAYNAKTIISWDSIWVPLLIWTNALLAGPILAIGALYIATRERSFIPRSLREKYKSSSCVQPKVSHEHHRSESAFLDRCTLYVRAMFVIALCAWVASIVLYLLQMNELSLVENHVTHVFDQTHGYLLYLGAFMVLSAVGLVIAGYHLIYRSSSSLLWWVISVVLVYAGIFSMRFLFYVMHLTVGISL